jgi:GntR family transcriptional regulator / MocR family aminotransferase
MREQWANSGRDLHLVVAPTAVRASIEQGLRDAIQSGRLTPGTLLPPSRSLSQDLGVARNTVAEVYAQLSAEGWLVARQGSGTRVAALIGSIPPVPPAPEATTNPLPYDLRPGQADVSTFPRQAWLASARRAMATAPAAAFGYGDPQGRPELRQAVASYLARARGVRANADTVVICSGFHQALWLLGRVLREQGHRQVAAEAFGHQSYRTLLEDSGLQVAPVEVDDAGGVPPSHARWGAVLLTPAHQFPLGFALTPERRTEFVRWARNTSGVIIEDDYDAEFRYDRRAVGAMQALAPEHIVYAGTASKTLAPGLRLGWLVLPERLFEPFVAAREQITGQASVIDQLTLADFIASGAYDRHVRRSRLAYARRRRRFVEEVSRHLPSGRLVGLAAGLHSVLELPSGLDEAEAVRRAKVHGVAVARLDDYAAAPGQRRPSLVVGWAAPPAHTFTSAVRRLTTSLTPDRRTPPAR